MAEGGAAVPQIPQEVLLAILDDALRQVRTGLAGTRVASDRDAENGEPYVWIGGIVSGWSYTLEIHSEQFNTLCGYGH
jgi:hypothetical protein